MLFRQTCCILSLVVSVKGSQTVFSAANADNGQSQASNDVDYLYPQATYPPSLASTDSPEHMTLYSIHQSNKTESYDLTFFADGYTSEEEDRFIDDAKKLTDDIVSQRGAMYHVAHLLNVWAVFTPSKTSGIGTHDSPIAGAPFGLYRPGAELRGVYIAHHQRARGACAFWRESDEGGCDQPIILGNDGLYGGLGGEFTVITASKLNGPIVLRHELGHSLIDVGEEYEGGEVYSGVNADKVNHLQNLKWKDHLTDPENIRIEDTKVPLQQYPWYNLTQGPYKAAFTSSNRPTPDLNPNKEYPRAMIRFSLSSIPYPSHIIFSLNDVPLNISSAFLAEWEGSRDRRWLEVELSNGLPAGVNTVEVKLSEEGERAKEGQGGKMLTSLEFVEYGTDDRFNGASGFVGAFPTFDLHGNMTLRPTNEECLMRRVNAEKFCPVCRDGLEAALLRKIKAKCQST